MEMYERSYEDQSYSAMRQQVEDAGLSVGLMYGGNGSGGGQGSTVGAPQGATGGATSGQAPNYMTEEKQSSLECSLGFTPRKGKKARRERDCVVDCNDFEACERQRRKAYWKEGK